MTTMAGSEANTAASTIDRSRSTGMCRDVNVRRAVAARREIE
jgi:hypothetical protein